MPSIEIPLVALRIPPQPSGRLSTTKGAIANSISSYVALSIVMGVTGIIYVKLGSSPWTYEGGVRLPSHRNFDRLTADSLEPDHKLLE